MPPSGGSLNDTKLFSQVANGDATLQKRVAAALLFTPGTSQVFYGVHGDDRVVIAFAKE